MTCLFTTGRRKNSIVARPISRRTQALRSIGNKRNDESALVMAADFSLEPSAETDVAEAYAWYEKQRLGLGEEFLNCVDACIQQTVRMPKLNRCVYMEYRRALEPVMHLEALPFQVTAPRRRANAKLRESCRAVRSREPSGGIDRARRTFARRPSGAAAARTHVWPPCA